MISRLFKIPYRVIELDTITLKIYYKEGVLSRCYVVIENSTKDFYLRFAGNTKPFWLLLSAAVEEDYKKFILSFPKISKIFMIFSLPKLS